MGGEGTETLLNALLVSDIGKDFRKDRKLTSIQSRNMKSGLSHEGKKTDGFQTYGFTTGIRTGDDQKVKILTEMNIDGNDLFRRKQRMASLADVNIMIRIKNRLGCV